MPSCECLVFFKKNFPICKMRLTFLKFKFQIPGRASSKLDNVSSNHVTRSSLGSHINYNSTPQRRSPSPYSNSIITMTREDGRIERRLETCSYQETEMVRKIKSQHALVNRLWEPEGYTFLTRPRCI